MASRDMDQTYRPSHRMSPGEAAFLRLQRREAMRAWNSGASSEPSEASTPFDGPATVPPPPQGPRLPLADAFVAAVTDRLRSIAAFVAAPRSYPTGIVVSTAILFGFGAGLVLGIITNPPSSSSTATTAELAVSDPPVAGNSAAAPAAEASVASTPDPSPATAMAKAQASQPLAEPATTRGTPASTVSAESEAQPKAVRTTKIIVPPPDTVIAESQDPIVTDAPEESRAALAYTMPDPPAQVQADRVFPRAVDLEGTTEHGQGQAGSSLALTDVDMGATSNGTRTDPFLCALYAREYVRLEIVSATDPDLITADAALIEQMASHRYDWCLAQDADALSLPDVPARETALWAKFIEASTVGRQGTAPAKAADPDAETGLSGFPVGSKEWLEWCRAEYRSWDEETRTVIRRGSGLKRVPCPG